MADDEFEFLSFDELLDIHARALAAYGGADGIVDENAIKSALAQPQWTAKYAPDDITQVAAAYLFHLASQQGFTDGNKRTALAATVEFLARNGYELTANDWEVYLVTMRVAEANHVSRMTKDEVADWILDRLHPLQ